MPAAHEPAFIVPSQLELVEGALNPFKGGCKPGLMMSSTSESRSTSPGSLSPTSLSPPSSPDVALQAATPIEQTSMHGLPNFDYPVPFTIRNTFVDMQIGRSLSFEEFYEQRKIHSCPVGPPPGLDIPESPAEAAATGGAMMASVAAAAAAARNSWMPFFPTPGCNPGPGPTSPTQLTNFGAEVPVLSLSDALGGLELGTQEMPTLGSTAHAFGTCRPCAFFHSKGCGNGVNCTFCHLCPAGEKKRRQKEKVTRLRIWS